MKSFGNLFRSTVSTAYSCGSELFLQLLFCLIEFLFGEYFLILSVVANSHHQRDYSHSIYSQIPIKYLLQQARKSQEQYRDLYPPLLRLLVTYYPQLCLVEDWLCEEDSAESNMQGHKVSSATTLDSVAVFQGRCQLLGRPLLRDTIFAPE